MFTGLIEKVGQLKSLSRGTTGRVITITNDPWSDPLKVGESVAVQGVCLTVVRAEERSFMCNVLDETLGATNLGSKKAGSEVNLERALKAGDRMGGHILTGHVDGVGRIVHVGTIGNDKVLSIECAKPILSGIVLKGSIGCDGVSLTVSAIRDGTFEVYIIPFTWEHTSLKTLGIGCSLNLETDALGKYAMQRDAAVPRSSRISAEFLSETGFI